MVNQIMNEQYPTFSLYQQLRNQLMDALDDEMLAFSPGGSNPTLGELCLEMGEVQQAYIDSYRAFKLDFSYRYADSEISGSTGQLEQWYGKLDEALREVVSGLSDVEIRERKINRGGDFRVSPSFQLEIYKEALLIFYGKVWVYLNALGVKVDPQWRDWLG